MRENESIMDCTKTCVTDDESGPTDIYRLK